MTQLLPLALLALTLSADKPDPVETMPAGFKSLFNGKDTTGWKMHGGKITSWSVNDGLLTISKGGGGWLMTEKEYSDFELNVDFRFSPGANSGVALRAPLKGDPAYQGMEIQILDDTHPSYKSIKDWQHTGAIYHVVAPKKIATKKAGEWNRYRITCKGRLVKIELNGEVIVDADLSKYEEKAKSNPGIKRGSGHIGFQEHGGKVEFKNIWIKEIEAK